MDTMPSNPLYHNGMNPSYLYAKELHEIFEENDQA